MKTILLILIALLISPITQAQKSFISGDIKGFGNDTLTIFFLPLKHGETPIMDKIICVDGHLNFEVKLVAPMLHLVRISCQKWKRLNVDADPYMIENEDISFFIQSGDRINFTAEPQPNGIYCQVFGNQINEQRNEFSKLVFPLQAEFNSHCFEFVKVNKEQDNVAIKKQVVLIEQMKGLIDRKAISFIQKHPNWEYSPEVLMRLPMDSCYKYFEQLGPKAKSSFFGVHAKEVLFAVKVGDQAPSFSLPNEKGKLVSLSEFRGKHVVLEFWGTWCGYCLKDIPTMKEFYQKYNDKVEFVGIACKDSERQWKLTLEKYGMNWVNLLNVGDELTKTYGVEGYPTKILINPKGIVIGKYLGEGSDFYKEFGELCFTAPP